MRLLDLNDNSPRIDLPSSQDVPVNSPPGYSILDLYATDPDFGVNGTTGVMYSISGNDNFMVTSANILTNR